MADGIHNKLFAFSEPDQEFVSSGAGIGARLNIAGRLGMAANQGAVEMPTLLPGEEEAIAQVSQRLRTAGSFGDIRGMQTLDQQESQTLSGEVLRGAVMDALDAPTSLEKSEYVLEEVGPDVVTPQTCGHCGAKNPAGMKFCVQCGGSLKIPVSTPQRVHVASRQAPPPSSASEQKNPWEVYLISINEDGSDGNIISLDFLETTVGRGGDKRFPTDAFLSPQHARLHVRDGDLYIEDLHSLNGTFLKLRKEVKLSPSDTFLMGRQVLRFERFEQTISPKTKSNDGTRYMGSPAPGGSYKILQIGIGGAIQNVYCLPNAGAILGREKGDIIFPHDKFMSSKHAQIYQGDDGDTYLVDLNSSNGTWIKLWERARLRHNDYIFMGQQLFRIHLPRAKN